MAVTANQIIVQQSNTKRRRFPLAEDAHLYQGTMTFVDSDGNLAGDTASGANKFAGIAVVEMIYAEDDGRGRGFDARNEVLADGIFELQGAGPFSEADVMKECFADDNYTITVSAGMNSVRIGTVVGFVSTTKLLVEIDTQIRS